jgi:hypothetical protein
MTQAQILHGLLDKFLLAAIYLGERKKRRGKKTKQEEKNSCV